MMTAHRPLLALLAVVASACGSGVLEIDYGDGPAPAAASGLPTTPGATSGTGMPPGPGGTTSDPTNPVAPTDPAAPPPLLSHATFGARCLGGVGVDALVLSDAPSDCATDARRLDAWSTEQLGPAAAVVQLDGSAQFQQTVRYCVTPATCEEVVLDITLAPNGAGRWVGTIGGQAYDVPFTATSCAYDDAVAPAPGDSLAAGISVDEVAVYQGVKVPVVTGGAPVNDLNAPVIAGRAGIVRVFLRPEADWAERDVRVRLTVGAVVREETFRPVAASMEADGASTVNFELAAGELPPDADLEVEVLEVAACADVPGVIAAPQVAAPLDAQALAANMRIMLVPVAYDADGSGRLPTLDAAAVARYKAEALTHYPVPDVEITVRDAVSYGGALSPNGSGFGEALNFCLNVRANDNPDDEVYYYCVFQPASSSQAFCGSGCVAGVAPLAGANDVGARGGIGISFGGDGEGVFVHEIGHALGRPHSPCGGAAGTDPNYPYAQGLIGSWGYDIMNGQLFRPDQRADFMGYCQPTWVSDYTYGLLFDRLRQVIGTQQLFVATAPTRWRTAVLERGELHWGGDRTLRRLPTGLPVPATLRDLSGATMGAPQVYVTPVADIDAVLLTIEDTGTPGQTVEIPGYGALTLP